MSDEAVERGTGRVWAEWFGLLDGAGAENLPHSEIAMLLSEKFDVGPWWSQMVTVAYERSRKKRRVHQAAGGFQVSASKTMDASPAAAFRAWTTPARWVVWLGKVGLRVSSATASKTVRIAWPEKGTAAARAVVSPRSSGSRVDVHLWPKASGRVQVSVQHSKLASAAEGRRMQRFWRERLEALRLMLEK